VRRIRRETAVPIVLFSYFNPMLQYGLEALARDASNAGVDGVLATDITPEEGSDYCTALERYFLDPIFLAAPTSRPDRIASICRCSKGFIYVVSRTGVTGAQAILTDTIAPTIERVRRHTDLPVAVGFGISNPAQVRAVWALAEGVVVGSALVSVIEREGNATDLVARVGAFCRWLTEGS
jgi:tryptophan synthase alpha chain